MRSSKSSIDPTVWLRNQYTNESDEMICQICKEEMPFKKRNGEYYFESVEVLSGKYFAKEHEAQYLALCPLCAAKYKEFIKKDESAMEELCERIRTSETPEIPIRFGNEEATIRFVEKHFNDLVTIIEYSDKQ